MELLDIIKNIPLFKGLPEPEAQELVSMMRAQKVKQGEVLFRKGSEGTTLYIIAQGAVKIVLPSRLGDEMIVTIFSEGDFFGEMALLDGFPRSADAVAVESSRLLLLNRTDFFRFLKKSETAIESVLSCLSERLRKTDDLLEDTSFLNIPARFAKKLLELGETFGRKEGDSLEISLRLTQKDLADMVGATRESINKELRVLRDKEIIELSGHTIRIVDMNRLKRRVR
jgi:CRP-like cAMP-binding protein